MNSSFRQSSHRMRGSFCDCSQESVPLLGPSFTAISSQSCQVCANTLSTLAGRYGAALQQGMMIDTLTDIVWDWP
jgi:hypothetical protein